MAAFLLAASTASALTPHRRLPLPRVAREVAARSSAETFRPLAPGETRFLGPSSAPFVANIPATGVTEASRTSSAVPRVISISSTPAGDDPWTDTVVVASPRPDSSWIDAILTGAVVRIALDVP